MKKVLIRPTNIKRCWETQDACIVEENNGKKWVCEKTLKNFISIGELVIRTTFEFVSAMVNLEALKDYNFIELDLLEKGKSE